MNGARDLPTDVLSRQIPQPSRHPSFPIPGCVCVFSTRKLWSCLHIASHFLPGSPPPSASATRALGSPHSRRKIGCSPHVAQKNALVSHLERSQGLRYFHHFYNTQKSRREVTVKARVLYIPLEQNKKHMHKRLLHLCYLFLKRAKTLVKYGASPIKL